MPICTCCKLEKPASEFYERKKATGLTTTSRCKFCIKERTKSWRKAEGKEQWKAYNKKRTQNNKLFLQEERSKGCVKCGESRYYVIDFHHLNPKEKTFTIGATTQWTRTQLESELKKCIRLCRNCHSELHYLEKNTIFNINKWLPKEI
jgi:hypothetical protein